jgi:hypothetical protein
MVLHHANYGNTTRSSWFLVEPSVISETNAKLLFAHLDDFPASSQWVLEFCLYSRQNDGISARVDCVF